MLSLNDDVLWIIMSYLTFDEQILMSHVCKRFETIAMELWRQKNKVIELKTNKFDRVRSIRKEYLIYIEYFSNNVETLTMEVNFPEYIRGIENIQFPKLTSLYLKLNYDYYSLEDKTMKITKRMFPNLKALTYFGALSIKTLCSLSTLEEIHLYYCKRLEMNFFPQIFSALTIKKFTLHYSQCCNLFELDWDAFRSCNFLEEICIDVWYMELIQEYLFTKPTLRKIAFHTPNPIDARMEDDSVSRFFCEIASRWGKTMDTIYASGTYNFFGSFCHCLQRMAALRRLIFASTNALNDCPVETLYRFPLLKALEEFYYINCKYSEDISEKLLEIITESKNLEICDLSLTGIDVKFVEEVIKIIRRQCGKRKETFLLRCHKTNVREEDLGALDLPKGMKICFKPYKIKLYEVHRVEFERHVK